MRFGDLRGAACVLGGIVSCPALARAATATFGLAGPCAVCASGDVVVEIRASFDADLVSCAYTLTASGTAGAVIVARDADPTGANGLRYVSRTSAAPFFESDLPHDLAAAAEEVLLDFSFRGVPAGTDVLIETLTIRPVEAGTLTLTLSAAGASTMLDANPILFDSVTVDPQAGELTIAVDGAFCDHIAYVNELATGAADGTSWTDAWMTLQDALAGATANCAIEEIWVAAGTYRPDAGGGQTPDDRTATFRLIDGVSLYGGFDGTETARDQRDPAVHVTTLSGEIGDPQTASDNTYHVVTADATITASSVLDGVVITAGRANVFGSGGAGMYCQGSPTVVGCVYDLNVANGSGGGLYNEGDPVLVDCRFTNNSAEGNGGGLANRGNPMLIRCTFQLNDAWCAGGGGTALAFGAQGVLAFGGGGSDGGALHSELGVATVTHGVFDSNCADKDGGAVMVESGQATLTHCTLVRNDANLRGGAIAVGSGAAATLTSCILWDNRADGALEPIHGSPTVSYSCVEGGYSGTGNIGEDPLHDPRFVDLSIGNVRLTECSPCIDSGSNDAVPADVADLDGDGDTDEPTPLDLDGAARFVDDTGSPDCPHVVPPDDCGTPPIVDMGAYEFPDTSVCN